MRKLTFIFLTALGAAALNGCSDDNDNFQTVSFTRPYHILPENEPLKVEIRLSQPTTQTLAVPFSVGGNAVSGDEYVLSAQEFNVAAGQDSAVVTVTPQNNFSEHREIILSLEAPEGYKTGHYAQTTIPMETRTPMTVSFAATEYDLYEEGNVGVRLQVGSSDYESPSYDIHIPFEIDPESTAELGEHYEIVGDEQEFLYAKDAYIGLVRIRRLKKEEGKDKIVLRLSENDRFLASLDNDRAYITIDGPVTFDNLLGNWKFKEFLSENVKYYGGLVNEDPTELPSCDPADVLTFETRDGRNAVNTTGLVGDLRNYFIDGATFTLTGTGDDHMYYHSSSVDLEEHLDREVVRSTFSEVNLAFSPTTRNVGEANVDFRLIGDDELEVRIVQYEPTDFLVDVYNDRKDESSWNREGLPMKGQYTLIFRFTRQ